MNRTQAFKVLAMAIGAIVPRHAHAQVASWTQCTPGSFNSCHSVRIQTTPVMTGGVRTGTALTVTLQNLQGSGLTRDNTTHSGLMQVFLVGRNLPVPFAETDETGFDATMTGPGASGALTNWGAYTEHFEIDGTTYSYLGLYGFADESNFLGGCGTGHLPDGPITAQTCGGGAAAVFSMTFDFAFDADQFEAALIQVAGPDGAHMCISDPSAYFEDFEACAPPIMSTVPEPMTLILLGTGLAGMGGAAMRRRRRIT